MPKNKAIDQLDPYRVLVFAVKLVQCGEGHHRPGERYVAES